MQRFPLGEKAWLHHSFWPGTVFTRAAAVALTALFEQQELKQLVAGARIVGTEEVLLPTFTALVGLRVVANPFDQKFVRFREAHNEVAADMAILRKDIAFMHPVARHYDDPVRRRIRERFAGYAPLPPLEMPER